MRRFLVSLAAVPLCLVMAVPAAASDNRNNWHIHDGGSDPGHAPVRFFPGILGLSVTDYLADPATCPNATDKVLLGPSGITGEQLDAAGVCFTSDTVIHLWAGDASLPGPAGFTFWPTASGGLYYKLSSR